MTIRTAGTAVALALVTLFPASVAADPRGTADEAAEGTWKLTWSLSRDRKGAPTTIYGRVVQVSSDGRAYWRDFTRDARIRPFPEDFGSKPRCEGTEQLSPSEVETMRDLVRALFDVQVPYTSSGLDKPYVFLLVTRGDRLYNPGATGYDPSDPNADPRLRRAHAIFARYHCPTPPLPPRLR